MHSAAHRLALELLACLVLTTSAVLAQPGIRITSVPERILLPVPAGSNWILEVAIDSLPDAIWIATDLKSADTFPLQPVGTLRYQCNLADPRLVALLPAAEEHGELFVFAKSGGQTIQSAAISWARSNEAHNLRCLIRYRDGTSSEQRRWLNAAAFESIELQGTGARHGRAHARMGEFSIPLDRRADQDRWLLQTSPLLVERMAACHRLEIEYRYGASTSVISFELVPSELELADTAPFVIKQRERFAIPGSRKWLTAHLGDITAGKALLTLATAEGDAVVPAQHVQERDRVEFALGKRRYVLCVDRLVNLLIGDDYVEMRLLPAEQQQPDPIGALVRAVAASPDTFLREGTEYSGAEAAQFLRAKLSAQRDTTPSLDEFIDNLASRSSRTATHYQVRDQTGKVITMQQWLRTTLARLQSADPERDPKK